MTRHILRLCSVAILTLLILGLSPVAFIGHVSAEDATTSPQMPVFLLAPKGPPEPYFSVSIEPGQRQPLTVQLGNQGTESIESVTFAADAYSRTNGGFGNRDRGAPISGPTTWLDYTSATLDLKPGQVVERAFDVAVPPKTAPGQYISAIVLQTANPLPVHGTDMLKQTILKSIAVFITVPGPLEPKFEIGKASVNQADGSNLLVVPVTNRGNVLVKPAGTIDVKDAAGETVVTSPVTMGSIYAGDETTIETPISHALAPGLYSVSVTLEDQATGAKAEASLLPITLADPIAVAPVPPPITIDAVVLEPARDAATDALRYVGVSATIVNTGVPLENARLTLHVTRDGQTVEDFALNSSLAVPSGKTRIDQRYLPSGDWIPGTYTFSVLLEEVSPQTGQTTLLAKADAPSTVDVP